MPNITSQSIYQNIISESYNAPEFYELKDHFDLVKGALEKLIETEGLEGTSHNFFLNCIMARSYEYARYKWSPLVQQPLAYAYYDLIMKHPAMEWSLILDNAPDVLKYSILNLYMYDHGSNNLLNILYVEKAFSLLVYFAKYEFEKGMRHESFYNADIPCFDALDYARLDGSLPTNTGIKEDTTMMLDWCRPLKQQNVLNSILFILSECASDINKRLDSRVVIINEIRELVKSNWMKLSVHQRMTAILADNAYFNGLYSDNITHKHLARRSLDLSGIPVENLDNQHIASIDYLKSHYQDLLPVDFYQNMLMQKTILDTTYFSIETLCTMYKPMLYINTPLPEGML